MKFIIITATLLFVIIHAGAIFFTLRNMNSRSTPKERFLAILDLLALLIFLRLGVVFLISML